MDPITCLSVAGTAVQFLDFSFMILSASWKICKDGELEVHAQAAAAVGDLRGFSTKLRQSLRVSGLSGTVTITDDDRDLEDLCRRCTEVADDLLARLDKLRSEKGRAWKSLSQALSSAWSKQGLSEMQDQLQKYMTAINSHIVGDLRNKLNLMNVQQSRRFDMLDQQTQQIIAALLDIKASLNQDFKAQTIAITQLLNRREVVVSEARMSGQLTNVESRWAGSNMTLEDGEHVQKFQDDEVNICSTVAEEILKSLRFPTIEERFDEVAEAHRRTLEWIFRGARDDQEEKHWSNFVDWLRRGEGLYWINGKAAAGKSTLMKYIYLHPDTQKHLSFWAQGSPYHIAGFFFWNSGTKLLRSQAGLFRSLLYEILRKIPDLIPIVFPEQWAARYAMKTQPATVNLDESWQFSSLTLGFETMTRQTTIPVKLCLFIDGLDEYEGDDIDMARLFQPVAALPHIKICASSRPHIVFLDAFHDCPNLRLEDLTVLDIQQFVSDRLVNDEGMQKLAFKEPRKASALEQEIVTSANGVFLWVKLVVASLLNGILQHDRIADLQRRLRLLPKKLEQLYEHMVFKIDEVYEAEALQIFQIVDRSQSKDDDWTHVDPLTIFGLYMALENDLNFAIVTQSGFLSPVEILSVCAEMQNKLRTRCGGLLEVSYPGNKISDASDPPNLKVAYLHRTVRDFLLSQETRVVLANRTGGNTPDAFSADISLLKSYLLQLKAQVHHPQSYRLLLDAAINHLLRVQTCALYVPPSYVEEIWKATEGFNQDSSMNSRVSVSKHSSKFALAAQCGLYEYLRSTLPGHPLQVCRCPNSGRPLLDLVVSPTDQSVSFMNRTTVEVLLAHGADPNDKYKGKSPWQNALLCLKEERVKFIPGFPSNQTVEFGEILKLLLQHKADPKAIIIWNEKTLFPEDVISVTCRSWPVLQKELLELLERNASQIGKFKKMISRIRLKKVS